MRIVNLHVYHDPSGRYRKVCSMYRNVLGKKNFFGELTRKLETQNHRVVSRFQRNMTYRYTRAILFFFFLHISTLSLASWPWMIAADLQNPTCINIQRVTRQYFGRSATRETLAPKHRNTDSATRSTFPLPFYFRFFFLLILQSLLSKFPCTGYLNSHELWLL